jgi:hypothetical protein
VKKSDISRSVRDQRAGPLPIDSLISNTLVCIALVAHGIRSGLVLIPAPEPGLTWRSAPRPHSPTVHELLHNYRSVLLIICGAYRSGPSFFGPFPPSPDV